ncbi:hypothetical protein GLOIN_2v1761399 [Rhizophagus clarus]|uniref:Uncharacterized protein n=1 Tax=Rhizophagus clarus TaxID=94130 RepID=A0A8H3QL73_9GLOM|nr:hypothetical protein GLOIN_2v1761399 [Rhizophagus clarus]
MVSGDNWISYHRTSQRYHQNFIEEGQKSIKNIIERRTIKSIRALNKVWKIAMGIYKSYKRRYQLKNCNKIRLEKQKKDQRDIHQQQVEGLFIKLDLKTHSNMSPSVKQSKLRLSSDKITKENLSDGLKEMRRQRTNKEFHFKKFNLGLILRQHFLNSLLN